MAVSCFNDGARSSANIMKKCGLNPGRYVSDAADKEDSQRIYHSQKKNMGGCLASKPGEEGKENKPGRNENRK